MPRPISLRSSLSDTSTPPLLLEGEPAVAVGPNYTKLWMGQGAANRLMLSNDPADSPLVRSIPEPTTAGNFLRTNTGSWVAGLPLTGGTLDTVTGVAGGGTGIAITTTNAAVNEAAIRVTNNSATASHAGINAATTGVGRGLSASTNAAGDAVYVDCWSTASGRGVFVITRATTTGHAFYTDHLGTGRSFAALARAGSGGGLFITNQSANPACDIDNQSTGDSLRIRNAATNHLVVGADGNINLGNITTGHKVTIGNVPAGSRGINMSSSGGGDGIYVNIWGAGAANARCFSAAPNAAATTAAGYHANGTVATQYLIDCWRGYVDTTRVFTVRGSGVVTMSPGDPNVTVLSIAPTQAGGTGQTGLEINYPVTRPPVAFLRCRLGTTDHFVIAGDGTITLSAQAIASLQAALGI